PRYRHGSHKPSQPCARTHDAHSCGHRVYWPVHGKSRTRRIAARRHRRARTYARWAGARAGGLLQAGRGYAMTLTTIQWRPTDELMTVARFPTQRLRRLRRSENLRRLVRETTLSVDDFIYPLFVAHVHDVPVD